MTGIYKILSPSGKVYIGKSKRISARMCTYKSLREVSIGRGLLRSFKKHGVDNHVFTLAYELPKDVDRDTLSNYEMFYISQFKEVGVKMLNMTNGGDGSWGYRHTEETKKKLSLIRKGKFIGVENPNYGKGCFGSNNGAYGKDRRKYVMAAAKANERPVLKYDNSGEFIKCYDSATIAAKDLSIKISNISACALGKKGYKTAGGYIWKYKEMQNV